MLQESIYSLDVYDAAVVPRFTVGTFFFPPSEVEDYYLAVSYRFQIFLLP